jgi:hypothetical protein
VAYRSRIIRVAAILGVCVAVLAGEAHATQTFRVVVVPGLEAHDLGAVADRGAVGLLVPGAGPETSARAAAAMLSHGVVRNSLRDSLPTGPARIRVQRTASIPRGDDVIVVGLPRGGDQPNNRRYGIAVIGRGYRGLLTSDSTRIPGIVSIKDVAPTALGEDGALGSRGDGDPLGELATLDNRITDNNAWRARAATWLEVAIGALALVSGAAAVLGVAGFLAMNLVLGAVGVAPGLAFVLLLAAAAAGVVGTRLSRRTLAGACAAVIAAYALSFLVDERWVALSPLGPTQNARFYGLSNLLETFLLVPALAGAALLARRPLLAVGVAVLAFVTVAGSRFGADGGGAVVLATGFAVLGALLAGASRRALAVAVAGGMALAVALIGLDALTGGSSHVTHALGSGPGGLASDLADRVSLSWQRVRANWATAASTLIALGVVAVLAVRVLRLQMPLRDRALPLAFAAALAASMIVNDSPKDVALAGAVGYAAVEALALGRKSAAGTIADRLRSTGRGKGTEGSQKKRPSVRPPTSAAEAGFIPAGGSTNERQTP